MVIQRELVKHELPSQLKHIVVFVDCPAMGSVPFIQPVDSEPHVLVVGGITGM